MPKRNREVGKCDIAIVGAGGAGMRAAIAAAERGMQVALITKGQAARSGATPMACPSYQAAFAMEDKRDSAEIAFEDTCFEGRYLGDENLISVLTREATDRAMDMLRYGVKLRKRDDGGFLQVVHPGHSYPRNLVIVGDGYAMAAGLRREVLKHERILLMEDLVATKIIGDGNGVGGLVGLDMRGGKPLVLAAKAVVLATGGYQELWRWTDTEPGLTGDGVYLAYDAGADLIDLEMMLYYPTGLCFPPEVEGTLVQYEGLLTDQYCAGEMLNGEGEEFLPPTDRLPVRDVMMKLMFGEIMKGRATEHGGVYIDLTRSPKSQDQLLQILDRLDSLPYNRLADLGIDVLKEPIEVKPVTHYTLGGVRINEWAETSVSGLFAAGEVSGNIHGANRTSGNALAETQVFGRRAGIRAAEYASSRDWMPLDVGQVQAEIGRLESLRTARGEGIRPIEIKRRIKTIMHDNVGFSRNHEDLQMAIASLRALQSSVVPELALADTSRVFNYEWEEAIEASMMARLAEMVAASASERTESRGHHWRSDHEKMKLEWERHTIARKTSDGGYEIDTAPVIRMEGRPSKRRRPDPVLIEASLLDDPAEG